MNKVTPLRIIRQHCLCCNGSAMEVRLCPVMECPLYLLRFGKRVKGVSPLKAIRKKCVSCGEGTAYDVKNCQIAECLLYPFRLGKDPFSKRKGNIPNLKPFPQKNGELSTQETENLTIKNEVLIPVLQE